MNSDVSDFNPEDFKLLPEVVKALEEPRRPRSVLNYMCGCDTADPVIRLSLDTEEKVRSLLLIWFASGSSLDALCQPFAPVIRELKAQPPTLIGEDWDSLEGKVAKVLLADQLSRSCFRGTAEAFSYDQIAKKLVRELVAVDLIEETLSIRLQHLPLVFLYFLIGTEGQSNNTVKYWKNLDVTPTETNSLAEIILPKKRLGLKIQRTYRSGQVETYRLRKISRRNC